MDRNYERLNKYEQDVENHLQKVEKALDDEINNLKRKIRDVSENVNKSKSQELYLEKQMETAQNEKKRHEDAIQGLVEEGHRRDKQWEEDELEIMGHEREIRKFENHNDQLRDELDQLNFDIRELERNLKALEAEGDKKGYRQLENKVEESLEKLQQRKAAQDSATRRLREDARYVEAALERVDERILDELRKRQSQSDYLDRKVNIFTKEKIDTVDEFHNTLKYLTNEDNEPIKTERKIKNDCERMMSDIKKQKRETQKLERSNSELKNKLETFVRNYEELRKSKADTTQRDFNPDPLILQEQKKLLKLRFSNREKEVDNLLGSYNSSKITFKRNRMDRRYVQFEGGQLAELKKELIAVARRESALKAKLSRLVERNKDLQEELTEQRKALEEVAAEVKRIDQDITEKDDIVVDTVTVTTGEDKLKTSLENKEAELEKILEKLELSNHKDQEKLVELRSSLYILNTRYQTMLARGDGDKSSEATDLRREIKQLKQSESSLNKTIAQLQREMQLSLIRREAAVGKAQSVVPLTTNIRGERREELETLRRKVEEKRKELEKILVE